MYIRQQTAHGRVNMFCVFSKKAQIFLAADANTLIPFTHTNTHTHTHTHTHTPYIQHTTLTLNVNIFSSRIQFLTTKSKRPDPISKGSY
jgi:hypothetical protein